MQSLYLTMAMSYDEQLLKWLDVLSEGYFIKTQFQKQPDAEVVAVIDKIMGLLEIKKEGIKEA